ncbi:peptidoglycan DD-metalloendopeptidase family protein [Succinimonas amylolytica]|uniref:peptidoglycan DD-metalloendopeptidase family protein n=1 Tax=Succinimonas amylolytica TaxID=83769 RepID=UPI00036255B4|nr:peptidoglycan DD-metalloendopeptidase family protein [Succinimonas amylolytica]
MRNVSENRSSSDELRFPIPKNHVYAICILLTISLVTAIFLPAPQKSSDSLNMQWSSTGRVPDIHQDFQGITYSDDVNATESIDEDPIADSELFGSTDDSDDAPEWYLQVVVRGDNINNIFLTLNQPYEILKAIENTPVYGNSIKKIIPGDKIYFLLDNKNQVLQLVKPLDKENQVRYIRNRNSEQLQFIAVKEPVDTHINLNSEEIEALSAKELAAQLANAGKTEEERAREEKKKAEQVKQAEQARQQELARKKEEQAKREQARKEEASRRIQAQAAEKQKIKEERERQRLIAERKAEEERKRREQAALAKAKEEKEARLRAEAERLKKEQEPNIAVRKSLTIISLQKGDSLKTAGIRAGLSGSEIKSIVSMFKGRFSMTNLQAGDEIRILFSGNRQGDRINAVSIQSRKQGRVNAFRLSSNNKYYDEKVFQNKSSGKFSRYPIAGQIRITSQFNPHRRHPVTGKIRPHNGTDFGVPVGTPVYAPADGVVERCTYQNAAGYYIVIKHQGAYSTVYMHLSKILVKPGQTVKANQRIALSGNTGRSTGPHLHYELRINNVPVNALKVTLPSGGSASPDVSSKDAKLFAIQVRNYKKQLGIK